MADKIPQFEDTQPIIQPQPVKSEAEGYDTFAKTLGSIASTATEEAVKINKEKSQSMYINSVTNAYQIQTTAQMRLLEHPDQADKIAEQTRVALDLIKQSAYVNNKDRSRLNSYISRTDDNISLKATQSSVNVRLREVAETHFSNFYDQYKLYNDNLINNPKIADQIHQAMLGQIHNLVKIGAITPTQAANEIHLMTKVNEAAKDIYNVYNNKKSNAKDYHIVTSNPLNKGQDNTGQPINESTGWLINHYNTDKTFKGVMSDIYNRQLPDPEHLMSLPSNELQHALMAIQGVQIADGYINSGESFPAIEKMYQRLSEKGRILNYKDQATRDALGNYIDELKHGNFLDVMQKTPAGNAIMKDFVTRESAIKNSPIDNDKKNSLLMQNKNKMVNAAVAYGQGHHIPAQYIQPIPQADIAVLQNSFNLGQDPTNALNIINSYSKENQIYLSRAMKTPHQQVVIQTVTLGGKANSDQEKIDFIASNQKRSYKEIDLKTQDQISDDYLKNSINSNITGAFKIISAQNNPVNATILNGQLIQAGVNYSKYLSEKNGQFSMKKDGSIFGSINNVSSATTFINNSYQAMTGANYIVNKKQIDIDSTQMDHVANYAIENANKYLRSHMSESSFIELQSRSPLIVTVSPTNMLQAKDQQGNIIYSEPLTENLIAHALSRSKELKKNKEEEGKRILSKQKNKLSFLSPDEQLLMLNTGEGNVS